MFETPAIDLHDVRKTYRGGVLALRGVSMHVPRGQIFGLLGPNGAGKSTLVKIMLSVVRPTHCTGTLLGKPVGDRHALARIGFLPESHRFPRYLTGRQILDFFGALSLVNRRDRRARSSALLELVGMSDAADRRIGTYSKGMAQRIGLAQAMMNDPDLLFLDEPTDGVDPVARRQIRDVLLALRRAGKTVFINSHLLSELELICDRVAIMLGGQVVSSGTIDELSLDRAGYEIELANLNGDAATAVGAALGVSFAASSTTPPTTVSIGESLGATLQGSVLRVGAREPEQVQPVIDRLRAAGLIIRRLQLVRPTLEDLFIEAVDRQQRGVRQ
jgi:ABC-2 type transport system ATP-binding protein